MHTSKLFTLLSGSLLFFVNGFRPIGSRLANIRGIKLLKGLDDSTLELCEDNASLVVDEIKSELGTIFGYDAKSREVGITGEIEFIDLDGPVVAVALRGRFWHATDTVMMRVRSYFLQRIPECIDVTLDMSKSDIVDDNRLNTEAGEKRLF
mmetsp:Transcript_35228/g.35883  ORF Transcript_35228/g.35883 Transcript_35228/m.35883 type:complete len:151 (-) Transcript_35228:124-576(-)